MYISTPPSSEVENFHKKIYYPAGDRTSDPLNQRQTCYHLSQRGELTCECGKRNIGETRRPLLTRVNEHKRNTTNGEIDKSKIAKHSWEQKHRFQWDKASIINKEANSRIRKLKESAFIHCTDRVIIQPSNDISPIWLPIIRPEIK